MRMRAMEPDFVHDIEIPSHLAAYLDQSPVALALADARGDNPLIFINHRFRELTGYTSEDVIGRNCRMLQRDAENEEARERIHEFLANDRQSNVRTMLINFRKDGSPFVNLLYMSKLRHLGGEMPYIFASQFDVSRSQPERLPPMTRTGPHPGQADPDPGGKRHRAGGLADRDRQHRRDHRPGQADLVGPRPAAFP